MLCVIRFIDWREKRMFISKNGKRLMAYIMSMAILLSGLIYAPKTADAAGGEPTVTVLGATIRLAQDYDNANGKQSMKFAIKVTNADKAKSCSIKLSLNGKDYIVSTKDFGETVGGGKVDKQIKTVSDKGADYVEYAVVVRDIPKANFDSSISITGYADTLVAESEEVASAVAEKSVSGVVEELSKDCPKLGVKLDESGKLVKADNSALTAYDVAHAKGEEAAIEETHEFSNADGADSKWDMYSLKNVIQIKKTDIVKLVLSSKDEEVGSFSIGLSDSTKDNATNVLQDAPLRKEGATIGEVTLDVIPNFFKHNTADISKVALTIPKGKTITLEKIIVIPTDEIAISVEGLTTIEQGKTSELVVEIADEDFDSLEWVSSKPGIASVKQDESDPKKAVVTGESEGNADISIKVTKDGKVAKEEVVKFTVTKKVSGVIYSFDISSLKGYDPDTGKVTLKIGTQWLKFPDNLTLKEGQKVKFTFDYEIPDGGNNIRAYLINNGNDVSTTVEGSQDIPTNTKSITCTASGDSNCLMLKGANWSDPNVILSGITMEFVTE